MCGQSHMSEVPESKINLCSLLSIGLPSGGFNFVQDASLWSFTALVQAHSHLWLELLGELKIKGVFQVQCMVLPSPRPYFSVTLSWLVFIHQQFRYVPSAQPVLF